jgi:putative membrane protein
MNEDFARSANGDMHISHRTQLALKRTRLAYDRTLMAWIRTATSLISFGFSIYKFFDLSGFKPQEGSAMIGPQIYASAMICTGLAALAFATYDHKKRLSELASEGAVLVTPARARYVAAAVSLLGILAMAAVIFHA